MHEMKIEVIDMESEVYPEQLRIIANPPKKLYCSGNLELLRSRCVAVVGSRHYSLYGKQTAEMIGSHLANAGLTVVSGLAYGIDAFAHEGVMNASGNAIAVLGTSLDRFYPKKNERLFQRIAADGLVITEYEPGFPGSKYSFPARNRIISGLSEAVIVVEAGIGSGSLITAQYAAEQNRDVYAVPGNINSQFSIGTNLLIRDGATPMIVIDDLIRELGLVPQSAVVQEVPLGEDEREIVDLLRRNDGAHVNEISHLLGRSVGQVSAIMTVLEIKGVIISHAGKIHLAK